MQKGDWLFLLILIIALVVIVIFALNIQIIFPTPDADTAAQQIVSRVAP